MKRCISRIFRIIIHLWRTLCKYVCKIKLENGTLTYDSEKIDVSINVEKPSHVTIEIEENAKIMQEEENKYDGKSDSLLESSRDEES